jgi:molybdopterin converting factor small subunit
MRDPVESREKRLRQPMMITVQVKLFATLRGHYPNLGIGEAMPVEMPDDATIERLVEKLGLPEEQIHLVFVNGIVQKKRHPLSDGDEIGIFPPVGGG